ncbi:MAG: RNA polymerase sigma factor [Solirubrobacterales bacterium]
MAPSSQLLEGSGRPPEPAPRAPRRVLRRASLSLGPSSDRRLANRASHGDRRAIAAIFERYQQELYGFCLGILGEPEDAQDALQNTMVKVLKALPGEEREIALRPWLYRIAHNEAVELMRTRRPTQALEGHLLDGQSSVVERAEQREQLGWLLRDLADLPRRQRTVLVMRELNGLDFAEIGAALDTSAAVVRQSLYEARRNLEQMGHGRGLRCDAVARVLSDADGRTTRRRDIRAHLRDCPDCQRFQDAIESRKGVLAAISPVPAAAAAGVVQAAVGGSSNGAGAALTGGVAKSAGAYGALKAAGTVAAVAVLGTSAIQYELRGDSPRHAQPQAHDVHSSSPAPRKEQAARSARLADDRRGFVFSAGRRTVDGANRPVANLRPSSPARGYAFAPEVSSRPIDAPLGAILPEEISVVDPPVSEMEELSDRGSNDEENGDQGEGQERQSSRPEKSEEQLGSPPKMEKKSKPEHPAKPEKHSPGQTRKAAQAEAPTPEAEPSPPAEAPPETASPEQPPAAEDAGPNGKAKGHEKHFAS